MNDIYLSHARDPSYLLLVGDLVVEEVSELHLNQVDNLGTILNGHLLPFLGNKNSNMKLLRFFDNGNRTASFIGDILKEVLNQVRSS